jgi:hypothetical protein
MLRWISFHSCRVYLELIFVPCAVDVKAFACCGAGRGVHAWRWIPYRLGVLSTRLGTGVGSALGLYFTPLGVPFRTGVPYLKLTCGSILIPDRMKHP